MRTGGAGDREAAAAVRRRRGRRRSSEEAGGRTGRGMPLLASFGLVVVVGAGLFSSVGYPGLHDGAPLCLAVVEVKILTDKIKPAPEAQTTGRCRLDSVLTTRCTDQDAEIR